MDAATPAERERLLGRFFDLWEKIIHTYRIMLDEYEQLAWYH
jgi:hypothetical protein